MAVTEHLIRYPVVQVYDPGSGEGIVVPVTLSLADATVETIASLDTGATDCIFARYVGEALGLEIEDGISRAFRTLSGSFTAYGHNVTLSAGGLAPFDCLVYFTAHEGRRNYLGRNGWLNRVRAGLVRYEGLLYPGLYDE
ncbi:MAG TPA: aspartyl protease family protein [Blastocatellia bacterium]|nr:aspartyl protease family protein [Blastocatellia bacterium]